MGGKTSAASKNKYMAKAYDRVNLILRKDAPQNKAAVQAAADTAGESLNAYGPRCRRPRESRRGLAAGGSYY